MKSSRVIGLALHLGALGCNGNGVTKCDCDEALSKELARARGASGVGMHMFQRMQSARQTWTASPAYGSVRKLTGRANGATRSLRLEWGWETRETYRVAWLLQYRDGAAEILFNREREQAIRRRASGMADAGSIRDGFWSLPRPWASGGREGLADGLTYLVCACDADGCRSAGWYDAMVLPLDEFHALGYGRLRDAVKAVRELADEEPQADN